MALSYAKMSVIAPQGHFVTSFGRTPRALPQDACAILQGASVARGNLMMLYAVVWRLPRHCVPHPKGTLSLRSGAQ